MRWPVISRLLRRPPSGRGGARIVLALRITRRIGFATITLVGPVRLLLGRVGLMVGVPGGVLALSLRPLGLFVGDLGVTLVPVRLLDSQPFLMQGRVIERAGAGEITARDIGPLVPPVIGYKTAALVVDRHQLVAAVGVPVVGVLDEVGFVGARLIIVVTQPVRQPLDHALGVVLPAPDPRPHALVIHRVVRWRIAERMAHRIGAIEIGVRVARIGGAGETRPGRGRQRVRQGSGRDRGADGGQGQGRQRRRHIAGRPRRGGLAGTVAGRNGDQGRRAEQRQRRCGTV